MTHRIDIEWKLEDVVSVASNVIRCAERRVGEFDVEHKNKSAKWKDLLLECAGLELFEAYQEKIGELLDTAAKKIRELSMETEEGLQGRSDDFVKADSSGH